MQSKSNIWQHWQPIVGIASFLVAMGAFYSETKAMKKDIVNIENRQDRQFQMILEANKRISDLEIKAAYEEGRNSKK